MDSIVLYEDKGFLIYARRKGYTRIYDIAVLPAYRNRGIAGWLIGFVEYVNPGCIRLECKPRLRRFYEKRGYEVYGETPGYYANGEKCLRMRKQ